jgi:hypothetical protein
MRSSKVVKTKARASWSMYVPPQLRSDCIVDFLVASDMVDEAGDQDSGRKIRLNGLGSQPDASEDRMLKSQFNDVKFAGRALPRARA